MLYVHRDHGELRTATSTFTQLLSPSVAANHRAGSLKPWDAVCHTKNADLCLANECRHCSWASVCISQCSFFLFFSFFLLFFFFFCALGLLVLYLLSASLDLAPSANGFSQAVAVLYQKRNRISFDHGELPGGLLS